VPCSSGLSTRLASSLKSSVIPSEVCLANKLQKKKPGPEKIAKATESVRKLLPVTGRESMIRVAVALSAGFCEEFLNRSWLLNVTGAALKSVWLALLVSSIFFGFAHLYQGRSSMISACVLGLVFGLIYFASGSLLPAQILHILLDLNNGAWPAAKPPPEPNLPRSPAPSVRHLGFFFVVAGLRTRVFCF
jgi:membrane protease YdiL (CAAX protease family)